MSEQTPDFGPEFWQTVERRARIVRGRVHEELDKAEHLVFSEAEEKLTVGADGNVLPVFTDPFWTEVEMRAERVQELALETLAAAEAKLLGDEDAVPETVAAPARRRAGSPVGNLARVFNLQRADAFGFVAALLAVVLLVPQVIAPVYSSAGVEPPKLLRFVTIGDNGGSKQPPKSTEEGAPAKSNAAGSAAEGGAPAATPSPGASASNGADAAVGGEGGTSGTNAAGAAGTTSAGAAGAAPESSPSPAASPAASPAPPKAPAVPTELRVAAVDSTSVRITWVDASTDETGFQVDRQVPEASPASTEHAAKDTTGLTWTNLSPSTTACFRVRSVVDQVRSEWAPAAAPGYLCATTLAAPADTAPPGGASQPEASPSPAPPAA